MRHTLAAVATVALLTGLSLPAHAVVCSGTTTPVGSGGTVTGAFLLGTGNCVTAADKIFGQFSSSGAITGDGSASFTFAAIQGNVTIGFSGVVGQNSVGGIVYSVAVDPVLAGGFLIDDLQKDFTFNQNDPLGAAAAVTLTGVVTPSGTLFSCTRTIPNNPADNCPVTHTFAPINQITVSETLTTGPNATVTALTDTVSQIAPVTEPASLALLGTGLLVMGVASRWARRRKDDDTGCAAV